MDNASFHPKNILDELCVQDKHFFLPLPPYSPDLNPIEQAWAILKKKVTDLLREVPNVFDGNIQKLLATVISTNSIAELIISAILTLVIVPRLEKIKKS